MVERRRGRWYIARLYFVDAGPEIHHCTMYKRRNFHGIHATMHVVKCVL